MLKSRKQQWQAHSSRISSVLPANHATQSNHICRLIMCGALVQVAGVRKPLSSALDGLPAAAVRLGLLAKHQQQQQQQAQGAAGHEANVPADEVLGGSLLPGDPWECCCAATAAWPCMTCSSNWLAYVTARACLLPASLLLRRMHSA
jgi:hypothetical protein